MRCGALSPRGSRAPDVLRALYSGLMLLALPLIVLRLYWRGRREPRYRAHIGERFGHYPQARTRGAIWLHAVSVGEMRAAQPLVDAMCAQYPGHPLLLTCMTPTGRDTAQQLYGVKATIAYLPYDLGILVRRLLGHFQPRCLIVMETEIWPNVIAACHAQGVPAVLVNARLSEKSLRNYGRLPPVRALIGHAVRQLAAIGAQHARDAGRLAALGAPGLAPPSVTGNLKYDALVDAAFVARGQAWRAACGARAVMLAVSTRDGEERAIAEAYARAFAAPEREKQLLVVVPRHPPRFDEAARLLVEAGLTVQRRSADEPIAPGTDAWLGDSMGEVAAYVAMCDFAFVGGSLLPLGGQNLIEVCAQGKPVLMGPSTYNFADAARAAREAGALVQVADADELMRVAATWFADRAMRDRHAQAATAFAQAHRGATQKTLALLAPLLGASGGKP
ncbi:MAG: 3-deoxy-D-manno-octulosonic acid transferase [Betaproteobacteria bacterium]|nr:3-deoxy-D-manno-octulosonic acid transferase [Betaproteobacteria bacterium]